jgi:hypothetical protein
MFKYFKEEEVKDLKYKLVYRLETARELAGIPFIITSGFRSPEEDVAVGASGTSAHTRGLAVDLRCRTSQDRFKIVRALILAGFNRIGDEIDHVHADIDDSLPQDVIFLK